MKNNYNGSTWNKWDLHIHTPLSIEQHYGGDTPEVWEKFISDLEKLPTHYKVIGINDYFFIDWYEEIIKYKSKGRLSNIDTILPVIEFRIEKFAGVDFKKLQRINLHVIFSEELSIETIRSQFLNTLHQSYMLEKDGNKWERAITRQSMEELGKEIKKTNPQNQTHKYKTDLIEGFNNLNICDKEIFKALEKDCFKNKYLVSIGKTEWAELDWTDNSIATKKTIINQAHLVFTASPDIHIFNKAKVGLTNANVKDLLLDCSDAHYFSDSPNHERIGNCFSWIKADTTFEGLRQICHEPNSRLRISETEPTTPPLKINSISLKFLEETKIVRKEDKGKVGKASEFCLSGDITVHFSPYFTCLIGGRGAGKSTILNIIAKQLGGKTEFFDKNELTLSGKSINFNDYVTIDGTTNEFEFVSQNQVERFAESEELTEAIYERLNDDGLVFQEERTASNIQHIEKQIKDINEYEGNQNEITKIEVDLTQKRKLVQAFSNPDYKKLIESINNTNNAISSINESKKNYEDLKAALVDLCLLNENNVLENPTNQYDIEIKSVLKVILDLETREINFDNTERELISLLTEKAISQASLNQYYINQGVTSEQISIYNTAVNQIPILESKIEEIKKQQSFLAKSTEEFIAISQQFEQNKIDYESKIKDSLTPLNEKLEINNPNLAYIKFEYEFNQEKAKDKLFDEFERQFKLQASQSNTKRESVRDYLFCVEPLAVNSLTLYLDELEKKGETNAKSYLKTLFEKEIHFETYKLLIKKVYIDVNEHKKIIGFYGGKELKNCSFGQRCTAVIVALLMFGNKPLIIDEPEAHLDSKLIAEYLVDLIKQRKHERQIIFATHNANFVINGDAELIQILEVDEKNRTKIISTSIENLIHRDKLLALEGGKIAFEKRDKKLLRKA